MTKTPTAAGREPIVDQCEGCNRILVLEEGKFCNVVPKPVAKWRNGNCNFATHIQRKVEEQVQKINPLKASKRAAASKK